MPIIGISNKQTTARISAPPAAHGANLRSLLTLIATQLKIKSTFTVAPLSSSTNNFGSPGSACGNIQKTAANTCHPHHPSPTGTTRETRNKPILNFHNPRRGFESFEFMHPVLLESGSFHESINQQIQIEKIDGEQIKGYSSPVAHRPFSGVRLNAGEICFR
jgi:hypothetical protein